MIAIETMKVKFGREYYSLVAGKRVSDLPEKLKTLLVENGVVSIADEQVPEQETVPVIPEVTKVTRKYKRKEVTVPVDTADEDNAIIENIAAVQEEEV